MVREIILSKAIIYFITDDKDSHNYDKLTTAIISNELELEESVCILDMDTDISFSKNKQGSCKNIVCISSLWTLEKCIRACEYDCRAFLKATNLFSIKEILELVIRHKMVVFDESVSPLIRNLL